MNKMMTTLMVMLATTYVLSASATVDVESVRAATSIAAAYNPRDFKANATDLFVNMVMANQLGCSGGDNCTCKTCKASGYSYFCPSNSECYNWKVTCDEGCSGTCVSVKTCAGTCSDGDNCNCNECAAAGYSMYCPSTNKCYSYEATCGLRCDACVATDACNGCSSTTSKHPGHNCSCSQCNTNGFSWYCSADRTCYNTKDTCSINCGENCVPTKECAYPTVCSPSAKAGCGEGNTCCVNSVTHQTFCASGVNQTCCNYGDLTCPNNYNCYPPGKTKDEQCVKSNPATTACRLCKKFGHLAAEKGVGYACTLMPSLCPLLKIAMKALKYEDISVICNAVGLCNSAGCTEGYCNPSVYGNWCLALHAACPEGPPPGSSSAESIKEWELVRDACQKKRAKQRVSNLTSWCLDGYCDESTQGCCLTGVELPTPSPSPGGK